MIYVRPYKKNKSDSKGLRVGKWELLTENYFLLVIPVIVAIIYTIVWELPSFIYRLPANEAYNYIDMICADTDADADVVIETAKVQEMYNEADETYDIQAFMKFLAAELGQQLLEKGIVEEEGDVPVREVLEKKYLNAPRYNRER